MKSSIPKEKLKYKFNVQLVQVKSTFYSVGLLSLLKIYLRLLSYSLSQVHTYTHVD